MMISSILIGKEQYMFLRNEMRTQRGFAPLTREQEYKLWVKLNKARGNSMVRVTKDSFGGGDGTKNGKWWGWSLEQIMAMLDEAGFSYENGVEIERLSV